MTFINENYEIPENAGLFLKLNDGDNKIRIVSSAVTGWVGWTKDNNPIRKKDNDFEGLDLKDKPKHFWGMVVWNYDAEALQLWELPQKSIQKDILKYNKHEDWGDPKQYDLTINKKGQSLKTEYSVTPSPKKPLSEQAKQALAETQFNLENLFTNQPVFVSETTTDEVSEDVNF